MLSRGLDLLNIVIGSGQLAMWSFCVALDLAAIMVVSNGVIAASGGAGLKLTLMHSQIVNNYSGLT